jgi:hypothetical protein
MTTLKTQIRLNLGEKVGMNMGMDEDPTRQRGQECFRGVFCSIKLPFHYSMDDGSGFVRKKTRRSYIVFESNVPRHPDTLAGE